VITETRKFHTDLLGSEGRTIVGLAAPYNVKTVVAGMFGEVLLPGVFRKSTTEKAKNLPLMVMHKHAEMPIGRAVAWEEAPQGLLGTWEFDTREEARETYRLVEERYLQGLSVGFDPIQNRVEADGDMPLVYRVEARLLETSLCPFGQYNEAQVIATRTWGAPNVPAAAPAAAPRPEWERWSKWYDQIKAGDPR
jgi:HK97 family phage prohead protease